MSIHSSNETNSSEAKSSTESSPIRSGWPVFFFVLFGFAIITAIAIYRFSRLGQYAQAPRDVAPPAMGVTP